MLVDALHRGPALGAIRVAAAIVGVAVALVAALGWLYMLRGLGWFGLGPRIGDSLPLLQLAGSDGQPLLRVIVAWIPAGMVAGAALIALPRLPRAVLAALLGMAVLALASQASFAVARNLRLGDVLWSRSPGAGPWLEGLLFAIGCALRGADARRPGRLTRRTRQWLGSILGQAGLRRGK